MTRPDVIAAVKRIVQVPQTNGVPLLLSDPDDYSLAVDQAVARFGLDRPNSQILDVVITTAGWRLTLAGGLTPLVPTWVDGVTYVSDVWAPFSDSQGLGPNDQNNWRVVLNPGGLTVLELLDHTASVGSTVRLVLVKPYVVADLAINTTIPAGLVRAFEVLAAYFALVMASHRAVQNTGSSGLPGDIVDRRSQSDQYAARARDLLNVYRTLMGLGSGSTGTITGGASASTVPAASGFRDLDVRSGNPSGFLWHGPGTR